MPVVLLLLRRYPLPVLFTGLVFTVSVPVRRLLGAPEWAALTDWASTDLVNLREHPLEALAVSALLCSHLLVWLGPAALALTLLTVRLGSSRAACLVGLAHAVGTLVSEGMVGVRILAGQLPASLTRVQDVGPSYVIVSALTAVVLAGARRWHRTVCAGVLVLLSPLIVTGLGRLDVTAVGHLVAMVTTALALRMDPFRESGGALSDLRRPAGWSRSS